MAWNDTDIDILLRHGAEVDDRGSYRVFRFPRCPLHHWGHFIQVLRPLGSGATGVGASATHDMIAEELCHWRATFDAHFPDADWVSILLPQPLPETVPESAYTNLGLTYSREVVLVSDRPLAPRSLPEGYSVRPLHGDADWAAWEQLKLATSGPGAEDGDNTSTDTGTESALLDDADPTDDMVTYIRQLERWHRQAQYEESMQRFGAFDADGKLCSSVGIFTLGDRARFNSVSTDAGHRRKGLASSLLYVADEWSRRHGCRASAIVADAGSDAERLYRSLGFTPRAEHYQLEA